MDSIAGKISAELLMKNIAFLSSTSSRQSAVTNKCCYDVISSTESANEEKFTLKLSKTRNSKWTDKFDEIMNLEKKFYVIDVNLEASQGQQETQMFLQLSAHFGDNLRVLVLHNAAFKSANEFCDILKNAPMLEKLEICRTSFQWLEDGETLANVTEMKNLKVIKVLYSSLNLFQCLMGSQISSLKLSTAHVNPSELSSLTSFLEVSGDLESIEIDREAFVALFESNFLKSFTFKLRKLMFTSYISKADDNKYDENVINFLESHSSSLEELGFENSSRDILKTILSKLSSLKALKLNSSFLPPDKEFYDDLPKMNFMTKFELIDRIPNKEAMKGILFCFPNLDTLKVDCDSDDVIGEILPFIAQHNQGIKTMHVDSLKAQHVTEVKFRELEILSVYLFNDEEILLSFIKNNPSITTLKVKWIYGKAFIDDVLPILLDETNVKNLAVGGKAEAIKAIYEKIKVNHKQLDTLELNLKTDSGVKTSIIKFPEEALKNEKSLNSNDADFDLD